MGILTADEIRKNIDHKVIIVDPYDPKRVQPNSIDVTLGRGVVVYSDFTYLASYEGGGSFAMSRGILPREFAPGCERYLDPKEENPSINVEMDESGWLVKPGIFYLMHVNERAYAPEFVMTITGKSSLARLGLIIHFTAAHAETGFDGQFTLEVSAPNHPVRIYPDMAIGQILFETITGEPEDYQKHGHYTGEAARGAVPSRSWQQFRD